MRGDAAYNLGHYAEAAKYYEFLYKDGEIDAGLRLADMYMTGRGVAKDPQHALSIYENLAQKNVSAAEHNLGVCYEYGEGTAIDYPKAAYWYAAAIGHGYVASIYNLGTLYAKGRLVPANDVEGLTLLLEAAELAEGEPGETARFVRDDPPAHRKRLIDRMTKEDCSLAKTRAHDRAEQFRQMAKAGSRRGMHGD